MSGEGLSPAKANMQEVEALISKGKVQQAINTLEAVVKKIPLYGAAHVLLATAYEEAGRYEDAASAWIRAHQVVPGSPRAWKGLRRCLLREEEVRSMEQAEAIAEERPDPTGFGFDDIDSLIDELETARIDTDVDPDSVPPPNLDDDLDDMVSETLGRIYAAQEQFGDAARVYRKLAEQEPSRAREHLEKARQMATKAREQESEDSAGGAQ